MKTERRRKMETTREATNVFYAKFGIDTKVSRKAFIRWAVNNEYIPKPKNTEKGSAEMYLFQQQVSRFMDGINRYAKSDSFMDQGFPAFHIMYDDKPNKTMSVISTGDAIVKLVNKLPVLLSRRFKRTDEQIKKLYKSVDMNEIDMNKEMDLMIAKKLMITTDKLLGMVIENIRAIASSPEELRGKNKKIKRQKVVRNVIT